MVIIPSHNVYIHSNMYIHVLNIYHFVFVKSKQYKTHATKPLTTSAWYQKSPMMESLAKKSPPLLWNQSLKISKQTLNYSLTNHSRKQSMNINFQKGYFHNQNIQHTVKVNVELHQTGTKKGYLLIKFPAIN